MKLTDEQQLRIARLAMLLFAGVLPTMLLCWGIINTIFNHFFAHAPYLLDAGWYSDVIYRAGFSPVNPEIACTYAELYFGVHVSPYITAFSMLSYVQPLPRIEWYALFQAIVFLPFGWATYALASRVEPNRSWRTLPITIVAAFAFTFNGQILRMIPYPHYEVAIASFDCVLLAMLVTGRMRWAWVCYALALSVREDAGLHTALAISPLLFLKWRGVAGLPSMRTLLFMFGGAMAATVVGVLAHKVVFNGASIMSMVYLGDPIYSHLDGTELARRVHAFLAECQFMYWPFLATCILAAVRRDPGYLLGWIAAGPWFVLNFLAAQPAKAVFDAYSGFPFAVAIFWVFVYGSVLAPEARRLRPVVLEAIFAVICLTATVGLYQASPMHLSFLSKEMTSRLPMNRPAVHGFVNALGEHRADFGRLKVDYSVAALALEAVRGIENAWAPGVKDVDTIAFHNETVARDQLKPDLFANGLDVCTHIIKTGIYVCTRERLPATTFAGLKTRVVPATFTFANSLDRPWIGVDERGVTFRKAAGLDAWLGVLPKGSYELVWKLEAEPDPESGPDLLEVQILVGTEIRAKTVVPIGATEIRVPFQASGDEIVWFRSGSRILTKLTVTHAQIRRL